MIHHQNWIPSQLAAGIIAQSIRHWDCGDLEAFLAAILGVSITPESVDHFNSECAGDEERAKMRPYLDALLAAADAVRAIELAATLDDLEAHANRERRTP